jgi:antitoxin FitA
MEQGQQPRCDLASIDSTPREVVAVPAVSIRNLDDRVKERLRLRAARHGPSMEAEMRVILTEAVREAGDEGLVPALMDRFAELGGVELQIPARTSSLIRRGRPPAC